MTEKDFASAKHIADILKLGIGNENYIVYKEDKDNKIFSTKFEELKKELLKYNIEFGRVPNKRVFYYLKKL